MVAKQKKGFDEIVARRELTTLGCRLSSGGAGEDRPSVQQRGPVGFPWRQETPSPSSPATLQPPDLPTWPHRTFLPTRIHQRIYAAVLGALGARTRQMQVFIIEVTCVARIYFGTE